MRQGWHGSAFLESGENLKPLVKMRFGREPSSSTTREIIACLQQGRLFYEAASASPLEIRPLQQFYGMVGFSKALVLAHNCGRLANLPQKHGLKDVSEGNCRIPDLQVGILSAGTFQEFNDVAAKLTRLCYIDESTTSRSVSIPSAKSETLSDVKFSLREILGHIPGLATIYRMTFGEDADTEDISLSAPTSEGHFQLRVDIAEYFDDKESLGKIVARFRERFPFFKAWRFHSAQRAWNRSSIIFRNVRNVDTDEFSGRRVHPQERGFYGVDLPGDDLSPVSLQESLPGIGSGYPDSGHIMGPIINGNYVSEFSFHYLGLFLLSSLVRYRPETWTHAISHSVWEDKQADDQALSIIGRFLDLNESAFPELIVKVLNPREDEYYRTNKTESL
jgi:hypothetical protein